MRRPAVGLLALAMLAACAIPTEIPNWDMTWNLPVPDNNGMAIGVSYFLPAGVTPVGTPATAFSATVQQLDPIARRLGVSCPACSSATPATKPFFDAPPAVTNLVFVSGLTGGTILPASQIVFTLTNNFSFDPIRPQPSAAQTAANTGTITVTATNGTATLGSTVISGLTTAIPPGQTTAPFTMSLGGSFNTSQPITVTMTMMSPLGDPVTMNSASLFTLTPAATVRVSSATVSIGVQAISAVPTVIDLSDIDTTIVARIADSSTTQGKMFLTVTNPFTVAANATLTFTGNRIVGDGNGGTSAVAIAPIVKTVLLPAATATATTFTVAVNLTGQELRRMMGSTLQGILSGTTVAGSTAVTPTSTIAITSRLLVRLYAREIK